MGLKMITGVLHYFEDGDTKVMITMVLNHFEYDNKQIMITIVKDYLKDSDTK